MANYRSSRLGEEIKKIVGEMLLREIKDPRLSSGLISVSGVEVTKDGSYATIFISHFGLKQEENEKNNVEDEILTAFNSSKGLIKKRIGQKVKLRHIPELIFKMDNSMEYGSYMEELFKKL